MENTGEEPFVSVVTDGDITLFLFLLSLPFATTTTVGQQGFLERPLLWLHSLYLVVDSVWRWLALILSLCPAKTIKLELHFQQHQFSNS